MKKISIIIPVYNMEKYLGDALDSVLGQTLKEIEVICVDDGSTDSSRQILLEYQKKNDNIVVLQQENSGSGSARNNGMQAASGEYIAFLDPDDFYPNKNTLEKLYETAVRNKVQICGGSMEIFREGKREQSFSQLRWGSVFEQKGLLQYRDYQYAYGYTRFIYSSKLLKDNNIVFPDYRRNQDPPFMVQAMIKGKELYTIPDVVYVARTVDKKIAVQKKDIICDFARGHNQLLELAKENNLARLQAEILKEVKEKFELLYYIHIYNGNDTLYGIIQSMNDNISDELLKKHGYDGESIYFLNKREIDTYISEYRKEEDAFNEKIAPYKDIIIYGAGKIGKEVFDYLSSLDRGYKVGFAVTNISGTHTARGIEIKSIEEYIKHKENAIVLVAVPPKFQIEMKENAKKLGFKNVEVINKAIVSTEFK